jgi:hypothetical protein
MRRVIGIIGLAALAWLAAPPCAAQESRLTYRWVYIAQNLQVQENVPVVQSLMRRAKAAGYNGIMLADYKFNILDRVPDAYFVHLEAVKRTAKELGLAIYPAVFPIGYSNGLLAHNPNLAEGIPVRDALFVVKGGEARLAPDPPVRLQGGDFETAQGDRFTGWEFQDDIGKSTFADSAVRRQGERSLRMEGIGAANPQHGNCRVMQRVRVSPFRQMHLSVWIKTDQFETPGSVRAAILTPDGRSLCFNNWQVQRTQDWTQYHAVFNTLDNREALIYLGVWGGRGGRLWWDDARLEEVGLLNLLRRPGCPLTVKGEDGTLYEEGRDFAPVRDERMGVIPWPGEYTVYHEPPTIRIPAGSRLQEGQRLRVSFYHTVTIYDGQAVSCLSEPEVYAILKDQLERVRKAAQPPGYFMSHDEMRIANWCEACRKRGLTPGQLLADNVRRCVEMIRALDPKAEIFVWSDMFDPFHNAVNHYYLVNGDLAKSWEGLPKEAVIVNWHFDRRKENMPWFAQRGHRQILAGYYDSDPQSIRVWLEDAKGVPGVVGVMYTTWQNRYDDLEAFAKAAWGE